jgi:AcrR family transcriptional regulator
VVDDRDLSRSELRKIEFEQRIAKAAIELFGELGVNETPITAIIKKAGVAHKTFFNHFPSKTHLLFYIARLYAGSSDDIFLQAHKKDIDAFSKLEMSFMQIAEGILLLEQHDLSVFKHIITGVQLGPENSKITQLNKLRVAISRILNEGRDQGQLQPGIDFDTYVEMICDLFIATMLIFASQTDYPLVPKMRKTLQFIKHSIFI